MDGATFQWSQICVPHQTFSLAASPRPRWAAGFVYAANPTPCWWDSNECRPFPASAWACRPALTCTHSHTPQMDTRFRFDHTPSQDDSLSKKYKIQIQIPKGPLKKTHTCPLGINSRPHPVGHDNKNLSHTSEWF